MVGEDVGRRLLEVQRPARSRHDGGSAGAALTTRHAADYTLDLPVAALERDVPLDPELTSGGTVPQSRSDRFVTSEALLPAVHVGPKSLPSGHSRLLPVIRLNTECYSRWTRSDRMGLTVIPGQCSR